MDLPGFQMPHIMLTNLRFQLEGADGSGVLEGHPASSSQG